MDIEILLWFQEFREATSAWLSSFFQFITNTAVDYYVLVPMLILFWTVDKKKGARVLLSWGTSLLVGSFLKVTFCVYRPWVRDARITPSEEIMAGATGYSFPSGHSFSGGGFWNGLLFAYRKYRGIVVFSVIMVLLIMFSRLYFTVHTPQDVLVGASCSFLIAWGVSKLSEWLEQNPDKDKTILIAATVLVVALLCYVTMKSYPEDYVDGVLLVDPKKVTVDGFRDPGRFYGTLLGWFIEKRFVKFRVEGTLYEKVMRSLVGGLLVVFWWTSVAAPLGSYFNTGIAYFIMQASTPLLFMTLYPWLCNKIETARR